MSLLSRWFGPKYDDSQLLSHAQTAVAEDPLVSGVGNVMISSERGVITITGRVHRTSEKDRIEGAIRSALRATGIKYDRIVNDLKVD